MSCSWVVHEYHANNVVMVSLLVHHNILEARSFCHDVLVRDHDQCGRDFGLCLQPYLVHFHDWIITQPDFRGLDRDEVQCDGMWEYGGALCHMIIALSDLYWESGSTLGSAGTLQAPFYVRQ